MTVQIMPQQERLTMLEAMGASPEEARLIDQHALDEARRAFSYGMNVLKTLTPQRVHPLAEGAFVGVMRFLVEEWRANLLAGMGQTRQ